MTSDTEIDNSTSNCAQLPIDELLNIAITYTATGGVGVLVACTILLVLLYARAYKTTLQRLIIYSVLTVLFQDSCHFASIMVYPHNANATHLEDSTQCAWLGFISNWSGWTEYMFFLVIIFYLLGVVCVQVKGSVQKKWLKVWKITFEVSLVLTCIFLPGLVMWIPMHDKKYGLDNGHCFFRILCDKSKEKSYFWYVFFFNFFGYELVTLFCVLIAIGLFVVYCVLSTKLQSAKVMMKYLTVLLGAVIINSVILNIIMVMYTNSSIADRLRLFTAVFATVDDFVFLSGYLLVFYSSKLSTPFKKLIKWFSKRKMIPLMDGTDYGTFKESERRTAPSETYYSHSVPYTGAFTSVAEQNE